MIRKNQFLILLIFTVLIFLISIRFGAVQMSTEQVLSGITKWVTGDTNLTLYDRILIDIRLPRAILTLFVGASLAVGGVLMQGLFINPIIEPGLIGTSSGAAFGASLYFVLGASFSIHFGEWTLPIIACLGAVLSTFLVFILSETNRKGNSTTHLLLTGIAINSLFLSGIGFLSYLARDPQARSITFWSLGSLSGANWHAVILVGFSTLLCILFALRYAKQLNALMLGTTEAFHLGVNVKNLKIKIFLINVVLVSVATAFVGIIGFVGLIVPHFVRILKGSDHRTLLIGSAVLGGFLLSVADVLARLLLAPAELPIGIVTTVVGAPVFVYLLRKNQYNF
ncbi:iron ABC transporter permease [Putridiphycobacter roseus]|uniref:Iron ABC transporter permease n=1 Tax=Putridiphycobacter roseus TaxID=2219161 RepID=A0A2W1N6F1_9FLAO|nr:iron ABC transporter permease [Putridiphycobacter roseus]PZE18711.1 iron ABC transporter permease [Putridiphycobacter roseus]